MLLGSVTEEGGPQDPFKINRVSNKKDKGFPDKVT